MPKINRSLTTYVKLPESLQTRSLSDAKMTVSITVTVPKELEKKSRRIVDDLHETISVEFKDELKKLIKKYRDDE